MSENNNNQSQQYKKPNVEGRPQHKSNGNKNFAKKGKDFKNKNNNKKQYIPPYSAELMDKPINEIGLTENTVAILLAGGIDKLGKVCSCTVKEMYAVQHFGKKQLIELSQCLKKLNVDFRTDETKEVTVILENKNKNVVENSKPTGKQPQKDKKPAPDGEKGKSQQKSQQPKSQQQKSSQKQQPQPKAASQPKSQQPQVAKVESAKAIASQPATTATSSGNKKPTKEVVDKKDKSKGNEKFDIRKVFPKAPFVPSAPTVAASDKFIKFQKGGKWGFKDKNGKEVIPPIYDEVFNFKGNIACVERKQMFGFINRENELIIPYKYDWASSFSEGYACVGDESKCGYINANDEVIIPFIYDAGTPVNGGKAQVKQNGKWGTLDIATKEVDWS